MPTLEAKAIRKAFGPLVALDGAGLTVDTGQIHGLIGPNGSGKSTLLHCIAGRTKPNSGSVLLLGRDITTLSPTRRARAGLSIKFQVARVYHALSVRDNLLLASQAGRSLPSLMLSTSRRTLRARVQILLDNFGLADREHRLAGELSHGEQQWLEMAMAAARKPKVLLLDEPTGGMSPEERSQTGRLIRAAAHHCAIVIVEHDLDFIRDLCDQITVLHQGSVVATGTPRQIETHPRVQEVYLTRV